MGMEFKVSSLEEMCDLMCDNKIPSRDSSRVYKGFTLKKVNSRIGIFDADGKLLKKASSYKEARGRIDYGEFKN